LATSPPIFPNFVSTHSSPPKPAISTMIRFLAATAAFFIHEKA